MIAGGGVSPRPQSEHSAQPRPRFTEKVKQEFRSLARAIIPPGPQPAPPAAGKKRKGEETRGGAMFMRAAKRFLRQIVRPSEQFRKAALASGGPSGKNDIISWLRAQGYSWAAIRDLYPGFFTDEAPPATQPYEAASTYLTDTLDWLNLWEDNANGGFEDDFQHMLHRHLYPHL